MTMKRKNNIALLDCFMRGETSPEEERILLEWFRDPTSKEEIFSFYRQKWEEAPDVELPAEMQGRMFMQIMNKVEETEQNRTIPVRKVIFTRWFSYAAAIILCIGVGIAPYLYMQQTSPIAQIYTVTAEKGQRAGVTLPDGTKVWLNSHTEIKYGSDYGSEERMVSLSGEAYFEVAKDKEHRFVVKAGKLEVEALGTSFNVKAYEEDDKIAATLFSGSIRAYTGNNSVLLSPGEQVLYDPASNFLQVEKQNNISYARMWRDNELAFNGETLSEIAVVLNRIYNVQVEFESEKIKTHSFCGVIKNNSLDNVIEIISLTAPITYRSVGDTIILSEKH